MANEPPFVHFVLNLTLERGGDAPFRRVNHVLVLCSPLADWLESHFAQMQQQRIQNAASQA
ncbi:hypothetical protein M1D48_09390 [Erwinia sp. D4-22]